MTLGISFLPPFSTPCPHSCELDVSYHLSGQSVALCTSRVDLNSLCDRAHMTVSFLFWEVLLETTKTVKPPVSVSNPIVHILFFCCCFKQTPVTLNFVNTLIPIIKCRSYHVRTLAFKTVTNHLYFFL